ncbi:hypothetical protein EBZ02_07100, partial [bacterium]|nr:hypothetical protein [bacterium]
VALAVTVSEPTTPESAPAVTAAVVVPSYSFVVVKVGAPIVRAFWLTVLATVGTLTLAAPLLVRLMLPLLLPAEAVAARRTYTVVLLIVPEEPTVTVPLNAELSVDTSKPEGGVTRMPAVMLAPETENCVEEEAVP